MKLLGLIPQDRPALYVQVFINILAFCVGAVDYNATYYHAREFCHPMSLRVIVHSHDL